jgi:cell division protein FtsA
MAPPSAAQQAAARTPTQTHKHRTPHGEGDTEAPRPDHNRDSTIGVHRTGFRPPPRTRIFTGLDIGTTKICAIIGEIDPTGKTTIRGLASTPSQGLRRGVVVDLEETVSSIRTAVRKAEEIAQFTVRDVIVGIAGGHIQSQQSRGQVTVTNPERGITRADIRRALDKANLEQVPMEREIIHTIPQRFLIDDGVVANPEGFSSRTLEVEVLTVTAAVTSAQNIVRAVRQAHYRASGIFLEPLASSQAVLTQEERDLGVVVIDIGGGTSDIAIWSEGSVRYTGVVPYGGDAITEDIRRGLKISVYDAENLKKRHGTCMPDTVAEDDMIEVPVALTNQRQRVSRRFLAEIIESRLAEILLLVREQCDKSGQLDKVCGGIVLTGGGALQNGADRLAEKLFKRPAKVGRPGGLSGLSSIASSPIYSTAVGLLYYGLAHEQELSLTEKNMFERLIRFFKKAIDWY